MVTRLGDLVTGGEIYHLSPSAVTGRIYLRGSNTPMMIELTGAPSEDLRGRRFEFEVEENDRPPTQADRERAARIQKQQIGPTGEMTASRLVRLSPNQVSSPGSNPLAPAGWQRCLFLEWFGPNGRMVIELANADLQFLDGLESPDSLQDDVTTSALLGGSLREDVDADSDDLPALESESSEEEPAYGLIPEDLNRDLEANALSTDSQIAKAQTPFEAELIAKFMEECKRLDAMMEDGEETPIRELLTGLELPTPGGKLTEEEAELALKTALAQLALSGIAFHICEHCSMREAYRIFVKKIITQSTVLPQIAPSAVVEHFSTSDFCKKCESEEF